MVLEIVAKESYNTQDADMECRN